MQQTRRTGMNVARICCALQLLAGCDAPPIAKTDVLYPTAAQLAHRFKDDDGREMFVYSTSLVFPDTSEYLFVTQATLNDDEYVATELTPVTLSRSMFRKGWVADPPCSGTATVTDDVLVSTTSGSPQCDTFAGTFYRVLPAHLTAPATTATAAPATPVLDTTSACGRFTACVCELQTLPSLDSAMKEALTSSCTDARALMRSAQSDVSACDGGRSMMTGLVQSVYDGELPEACLD